jgi:hypothetical protein
MRILSASFAVAALVLLPLAGSAMPPAPAARPSGASVIQDQGQGQPQGWWEREGRPDELRERYWRLPPRERARYNQLEMQIRQLQEQIDQAHREQYRILRWGGN